MNVRKALLIVSLLIACTSVGSSAEERIVRVAGDPYPPWTLGEAGAKPTGGIAVEIAEELFSRLDIDTDVQIYPFKRGLERIKHGEDDVILMVSHSEERERFMSFTLPIRHVKFVFYSSAELQNFDWNELKDLQPYRIGSVTGYNIGEDWEKAIETYDLKVEEVKTDIFNIEKLLRGRIDLLVSDHEVMQRLIQQNPDYRGKLRWHERSLFESVNNFGISRKSFLAPMLPKIDAVLQAMKDDGTFERIFCAHDTNYRGPCEKN